MSDVNALIVRVAIEAVVGIIAYAILLRRLADFAQPYRLAMAGLGEEILSGSSTFDSKQQVAFYLNNAFSGWVAVFAVFALPVATVATVVRRLLFREPTPIAGSEAQQKVAMLFSLSIVCANPIFGAILVGEFSFVVFILILISGREAIAQALGALMRAERFVPFYRTFVPSRSV